MPQELCTPFNKPTSSIILPLTMSKYSGKWKLKRRKRDLANWALIRLMDIFLCSCFCVLSLSETQINAKMPIGFQRINKLDSGLVSTDDNRLSLCFCPQVLIKEMTEAISQLPRKRFFRQRAHANPFSDHALH
jgi:hypothetical protein